MSKNQSRVAFNAATHTVSFNSSVSSTVGGAFGSSQVNDEFYTEVEITVAGDLGLVATRVVAHVLVTPDELTGLNACDNDGSDEA